MPTPSARSRTHHLLFAAALAILLGGPLAACGQKGALYHPEATDAPAQAPTDDATKKKDEKKPDGAPR